MSCASFSMLDGPGGIIIVNNPLLEGQGQRVSGQEYGSDHLIFVKRVVCEEVTGVRQGGSTWYTAVPIVGIKIFPRVTKTKIDYKWAWLCYSTCSNGALPNGCLPGTSAVVISIPVFPSRRTCPFSQPLCPFCYFIHNNKFHKCTSKQVCVSVFYVSVFVCLCYIFILY